MFIVVSKTDRRILQYLVGSDAIIPRSATYDIFVADDSIESHIRALVLNPAVEPVLNTDNTIGSIPVVLTTPTPQPIIADVIAALAASPSIDQPTKDALAKALQGRSR